MNKAIMLGRLTKEPEVRQTNTDKVVCSFTIAVNRKFARDGEPTADFFPVVTWNKLAEFCGKYFQKGRQVAIVGRLQNRSWDDADGKKHYETQIIADECYFADSKPNEQPEKHESMIEDDNSLPF